MPDYATKHERIAISGADDLIICSLLDRQQFADPFGDAAAAGISSAQWPLFGLAWPSGAHLAARMALRPVVAGERVLEVGCGLALASLVAHRRGADVTASDGPPLAAGFLRANLLLNALAPMKYRHGHWTGAAPAPGRDGLPAERAVGGRYDLIVGSDLLYERDRDGSLAAFIGRHAAATAEVWIVDPDRGHRSAFHRRMAALGFDHDEQRIVHPAAPDAAAYKGRMLTYRRSGARPVRHRRHAVGTP